MAYDPTFPATVSISHGITLAKIVYAGELVEKRSEACHAIGYLIGSVGNQLDTGGGFGAGLDDETTFPTYEKPSQYADAFLAEVAPQAGSESPELSPLAVYLLGELVKLVAKRLFGG